MRRIATTLSALCLAVSAYAAEVTQPAAHVNAVMMRVKNSTLEYRADYSTNGAAAINANFYLPKVKLAQTGIRLQEMIKEGESNTKSGSHTLDKAVMDILQSAVNKGQVEGAICVQPFGYAYEFCSERVIVPTDLVPDTKAAIEELFNPPIPEKQEEKPKDLPEPTKDTTPLAEWNRRIQVGGQLHAIMGGQESGGGQIGVILGYDFNKWVGTGITISVGSAEYRTTKKDADFIGTLLSLNPSLYTEYVSFTPSISILVGKEKKTWGIEDVREKREIQYLGIGGHVGFLIPNISGDGNGKTFEFRIGMTYFFKDLNPEKGIEEEEEKLHYNSTFGIGMVSHF